MVLCILSKISGAEPSCGNVHPLFELQRVLRSSKKSDKFSRDLSAFSICLQKLATSTLAQFEWKRTWPHGPESLLLSMIIPFQKVLGCHELLNSVLARQSNQQRCRQMAGFQNATYAQGASLRSVENSLGQSSRAALLKPKESYLISMSRKAFLWEKDLRTKRVRVRWSLVVKAVTASRRPCFWQVLWIDLSDCVQVDDSSALPLLQRLPPALKGI